jgi:hypothetical protein
MLEQSTLFAPRTLICGLSIIALLAATSCDDTFVDPVPLPGLHKVHFDSVTAPANVHEGDILQLKFWGVAGPNCCHSFLRLVASRDSFRLDVTGWAHKPRGQFVCCGAVKQFRGEPLDVFPVFAGDLIVVMHQWDGSALIDTVAVLPAEIAGMREP